MTGTSIIPSYRISYLVLADVDIPINRGYSLTNYLILFDTKNIIMQIEFTNHV